MSITHTKGKDWLLSRRTSNGRNRYPERIRVGNLDKPRVYVPERTCTMDDCVCLDTCVVNHAMLDGDYMSMEYGYKQCSNCGAHVFDCPTLRYCPNCGAKVVHDD